MYSNDVLILKLKHHYYLAVMLPDKDHRKLLSRCDSLLSMQSSFVMLNMYLALAYC